MEGSENYCHTCDKLFSSFVTLLKTFISSSTFIGLVKQSTAPSFKAVMAYSNLLYALKKQKPIFEFLPLCDMVLVMTVEPGQGGQKLIPETLEKVRKLKAEIEKRELAVEIQVDGGITAENAALAVEAGASILVAGSSVFGAENQEQAIIDMLNS